MLKHLLTTRQRLIKRKQQLEVALKELEGRLEFHKKSVIELADLDRHEYAIPFEKVVC